MRQIIRRREIVDDAWRYAGEAGDGPQVLELAALLSGATAGAASDGGAAGVRLQPADAVEELAPRLAGVSLVVVHFPRNGEGRGFTQGRMLRQRYGYTGELRAAGDLKRDHLYLLARCGFDSFDLAPGEDLRAALAHFGDFSAVYQPSRQTISLA